MIAGINPWLTMWSQPRSTIRAIVHNRPTYGVYLLAAVYALQSFFFYANWWSLGLNAHYYAILLFGIILSPLIGFIWLYFTGWVFHFTGRWCRGRAPSSHVRAALAWSKIPLSINVLLWAILIFLDADLAFVQDGGGPSSIFINFINIILGTWSLILLILSLSEIQSFTILRTVVNVIVASLISSVLFVLGFMLVRFVYLMI